MPTEELIVNLSTSDQSKTNTNYDEVKKKGKNIKDSNKIDAIIPYLILTMVAVVISIIFTLLALRNHVYDWDIMHLSTIIQNGGCGNSPSCYFTGFMAESPLHIILVRTLYLNFSFSIWESYIIISCISLFAMLISFYILSFRISKNLPLSIFLGLLLACSHSVLYVTFTGENDLIGGIWLNLFIYITYKQYYNKNENKSKNKSNYIYLGILGGLLILCHIQYILIVGLSIFLLPLIEKKSSGLKGFSVTDVLIKYIYSVGTALCLFLFVMVIALPPFFGYTPFSINLLLYFLNLFLFVFTSNTNKDYQWFYPTSDRSFVQNLNWFRVGMEDSLYGRWWDPNNETLCTTEFLIALVSIIIMISPIVSIIVSRITKKQISLHTIHFFLVYLCGLGYCFLYDQTGQERWALVVPLVFWLFLFFHQTHGETKPINKKHWIYLFILIITGISMAIAINKVFPLMANKPFTNLYTPLYSLQLLPLIYFIFNFIGFIAILILLFETELKSLYSLKIWISIKKIMTVRKIEIKKVYRIAFPILVIFSSSFLITSSVLLNNYLLPINPDYTYIQTLELEKLNLANKSILIVKNSPQSDTLGYYFPKENLTYLSIDVATTNNILLSNPNYTIYITSQAQNSTNNDWNGTYVHVTSEIFLISR